MTTSTSRPALSDSTRADIHPLGGRARVLLCSVFGPYAQDDAYGARGINPMELYQNQVTRVQGPFSLRMFHRSWGLMLIQQNIEAPTTLLDFPTRERFIEELRTQTYDIIGISAIIPNVRKVEHMCELIRRHQPEATIVVGGHVTNLPGVQKRLEADHVVRGEGVRWFRRFLGEDDRRPIRHPRIVSGIGARTMGVTLSSRRRDVAATLIPSVGCPVGCNFCATSAMFGGKGRFINFYETGDELFDVMIGLEHDMGVRSFFVMDENFLLHRKRALRLLELMKTHRKSWALHVFSSANVLRSYTMQQIVELGISWVWIGLEGKQSGYAKLANADTLALVRTLQSHGVCVLGSSIIGMEEHTPDNIDEAIDYAVSHDTEFHQFMLYTPIPGTALFAEHRAAGTLTDPDCTDVADDHGQLRFNFRHPHIPPGAETQMLLRAFQRDMAVNGPSVIRVTRTILAGYRRYRRHPDARVRRRFLDDARGLSTVMAGAVWATRRWCAEQPVMRDRCNALLHDLFATFGWRCRVAAAILGRFIMVKLRKEQRRLDAGSTHEPPTFYERSNQPEPWLPHGAVLTGPA